MACLDGSTGAPVRTGSSALAGFQIIDIERIAVHVEKRPGMTTSHAIAIAINTAKKWCATGEVHQWPGVQRINLGSRKEACKAVAEWEALKKKAAAQRAKKGN